MYIQDFINIGRVGRLRKFEHILSFDHILVKVTSCFRYAFVGIETYNDKQVDVWTYYLFEEDDKTTNNMVYTYKNEEGLDIPVL